MKHIIISALILIAGAASAAEIRVISGGAVEPGLYNFAQLVRSDLGDELSILYNTASQIAKRLSAGEIFDILASPSPMIETAIKEGRAVPETRVKMGRVGVGVIMRTGVSIPDVANVDALKRALVDADSVVINTASTGIYLEKLFAMMGIAEALKAKTTRYPTGAAVMDHVINGKGREIGFGAMTEIRLYEPKGIRLVGPLPGAIQNYTSYEAVLMIGASANEAARSILLLMATPAAKAAFTAGGVE